MFDTGAQQSMIGRDGWNIINRHDTWIYAQGVNMVGPSKTGRCLQLIDARCVVKTFLDGRRYLVILRQALFNPNSDENLFAEDQIDFYGVKVYSRPKSSVENN